jgi:hypothetical protein
MSGGAPTVITLVAIYGEAVSAASAKSNGTGVTVATAAAAVESETKELSLVEAKLHLYAIGAGERVARPLAFSSIIAQLPPNDNAERVVRVREYGDAFTTSHRAKLVSDSNAKAKATTPETKSSASVTGSDTVRPKRTVTSKRLQVAVATSLC